MLTFFVFGVWILLGANPAFRYYLSRSLGRWLRLEAFQHSGDHLYPSLRNPVINQVYPLQSGLERISE